MLSLSHTMQRNCSTYFPSKSYGQTSTTTNLFSDCYETLCQFRHTGAHFEPSDSDFNGKESRHKDGDKTQKMKRCVYSGWKHDNVNFTFRTLKPILKRFQWE